jgi:hypothetical protein
MDETPYSMGLVTDHPEWKPLLMKLEELGVPAASATVRREFRSTADGRSFSLGSRIEVEIRDPLTWAMTAPERLAFEAKLRPAVPLDLNGPDLHVRWTRPVDGRFAEAYLDAIHKLWREWRRHGVSVEAFRDAEDALHNLHRRIWNEAQDPEPLMPRFEEILAEARRHSPTPRELPPLPAAQVSVSEVMTVLRRVANGEIRPELVEPKDGWQHLQHTWGEFRVDGWMIEAFRRDYGMKYVQRALAPDGRSGDYASFAAREGNPFNLLEDDEQDAICAILETL